MRRLTGGFDTDTYAFELDAGHGDPSESLVLRHYRESSRSDRPLVESTVQNVSANAGHPVPAVPYDTTSRSLLWRAHIVMQRMPGISLLDTLMADPMGSAEMIVNVLGTTHARIHGLETSDLIVALTESGRPAESLSPFKGLVDISALADASRNPTIASLHKWLSDNRPGEPEELSLCHGDFHPGNILAEEGRVTGVIDWGNFAIGHAEYDVAVTRFLISIGPIGDSPAPREQIDAVIRQLTLGYNATYEELRSVNESLIDYYTALRVSHAIGKVLAGAVGADIPGIAHEGYAWAIPVVYKLMRRRLFEITGIDCGPLPDS